MSVYKVTTTGGVYKITTKDAPAAQPSEPTPSLDMGKIAQKAMNPGAVGILGGNPIVAGAYGAVNEMANQVQDAAYNKFFKGLNENSKDTRTKPITEFLFRSVVDPRNLAIPAGGSSEKTAGLVKSGLKNVAKAPTTGLEAALGKFGLVRKGLQNSEGDGAEQLFNNIKEAGLKRWTQEGQELGKAIDNISAKNVDNPTDLTEVFNELNKDLTEFPQLRSVVNRIPELKQALYEIGEGNLNAGKMTLKQSNELLKSITSKISQAKLGGSDRRYDDLPIFETIANIRKAQADSLPDELLGQFTGAKQKYGAFAEDYKFLKNKLNRNNLFETARTGFGKNPLVKNAAKRLLPEDILKELESVKVADDAKKWGKRGLAAVLSLYGLNKLGS